MTPNGVITQYEVSYWPASDPQNITTVNTKLEASFTTASGLAVGTAFVFTVTAFTGKGRGQSSTANISTLTKPCEHSIFSFVLCAILAHCFSY